MALYLTKIKYMEHTLYALLANNAMQLTKTRIISQKFFAEKKGY